VKGKNICHDWPRQLEHPSNTGLRGKSPKYQYVDMIAANHALLTQHLGVQHLRLVLGLSRGGMYTWMMGEQYPKFMDVLLPVASLPTQVAGQNRLWRKFIIELINLIPHGRKVKTPLHLS
jgi:homoserine O-acetyltransferase